MKPYIISLFTLFFCIDVFAANYEKILNEESAVQNAMTLNYEIITQSQKIELSTQKLKETRALYFPVVDLNINVSKFNNVSPSILFNNLSAMPVYLPAENIRDFYFSSRISVWQNLYAGGRINAANRLASINIDKSKNELNIVKNEVIFKVKTAFNESLYYKNKIKYLESLKNKRNSAAIGESIEIAKLEYSKSILTLLNLIGLDLNTVLDIEDAFVARISNISLEQCMLLTYQYKPDLQYVWYQVSSDELTVNLLSMQRYPTIVAGATQEWTGEQILSEKSSWHIFFNVNFPVFDGGAMISRIKQADINMKASAINKTQKEENIKYYVRKVFLEYDFWKQKAMKHNLLIKKSGYNEEELEIIKNLNKNYFALEFAIGAQIDKY
jgi:outer membrane protein TolC